MKKAPVGHEPFVHRDAAPGTVTVWKVAFRRRTLRRGQRRVHKGILITPPMLVNAPPERMKKWSVERDEVTSEEKESASQPLVIPAVSPICHSRSFSNLSFPQFPQSVIPAVSPQSVIPAVFSGNP